MRPAREGSFPPVVPGGADRFTTWEAGNHEPQPYPDWLVTELGAVDTEPGVLKTGKKADVHVLGCGLPDRSRECLLAAKRHRADERRRFTATPPTSKAGGCAGPARPGRRRTAPPSAAT